MAIDLLQKFFGTNPQAQQDYGDFVRRYQEQPDSISEAEAARRYRELMRNAPPDLAEEAHQDAFGQIPHQDRRALAEHYRNATNDPNRPFDGYNYNNPDEAADPRNLGRMSHQAEQQDPDLFDKVLGKDSPLNSTLGRAALAGAAAFIASRVLSGQGIGLPGLGANQVGGTPGLNRAPDIDLDKRI
jgi:hypothetical protein